MTPPAKNTATPSLTEAQRALVRDNLGLVAVHLRRYVPRSSIPPRHREREDLFQEGCLGLIRAALLFDPARNIPFAAFALPRIHCAVSNALRRRFTLIATPRKKKRPGRKPSRTDPHRFPKIRTLASESGYYGLRGRQNRGEHPDRETVGDRLREKYERALRTAAGVAQTAARSREDRPELVRKLLEERMLVPQPETRKGLRRLAREMDCSYARVSQCEKKMLGLVRETLDADPEFAELCRLARHDPAGMLLPLETKVEQDLAHISADEFLRKYQDGDRTHRATMLERLFAVSPQAVDDLLRDHVARLPGDLREKLLSPLE